MQDRNQVLRRLPIAVGILGSLLLVINRGLTETLVASQSRSDALGIFLSALLVLTGLLWEQIQPVLPESVALVGEQGFELERRLPESAQAELAWASKLLLTNTATRSVLVWYDGQVLLRRGVLGTQTMVGMGAIVTQALKRQKAIYLVDLKHYPGRVEFDYLPENTQGVICQPLGEQGMLVLGANAPRSYTQQDEAWVAGIAEKLGNTLESTATDLTSLTS
jgi:hypothetical protein